jgi:HEAT repeat protein
LPSILEALAATTPYSGARHDLRTALVGIGASSVDALISRMRHPSESVRSAITEALGSIRNDRAVDALIAACRNDKSASVRASAALALGKTGASRAFEHVVTALRDSDPQVRREAAVALSWLRDRRAIGPLVVLLDDPDEDVQVRAVTSVGGLRGLPEVVQALKHRSARVRAEAAQILDRSEDSLDPLTLAAAVPALLVNIRDRDAKVRDSAAQALGRYPSAKAAAPLAVLVNRHSGAAEVAVSALRKVLQQLSAELSLQDLKTISSLEEVTRIEYREVACTSWHPVISDEAVEIPIGVSEIRQLARQELIRRGQRA